MPEISNCSVSCSTYLPGNHGDSDCNGNRRWIFGYGSILWKTGFEYRSKRIGFVKGYKRRFWQGNTTHRGTKEKPGRVATLIPVLNSSQKSSQETRVWGVAYELVGEEMIKQAMKHLYSRECQLGGYILHSAVFHSGKCDCDPITTMFFLATPHSTDYLGEKPEHQMAMDIIDCKGPSGHNIEYVAYLVMYLTKHIPQGRDAHLSLLHKHICDELHIKGHTLLDYIHPQLVPEKEHFQNCCVDKTMNTVPLIVI